MLFLISALSVCTTACSAVTITTSAPTAATVNFTFTCETCDTFTCTRSTAAVDRVQVNVSQVSHVNVKLTVAAVGAEVVMVTAEQAVVQTESAEIKNSIDRTQILDLPLPTRNPLDLINGMAGIVKPGNTSDSFVHGLRGNATNITQDGVNVADNTVKSSAFFAISAPTVDTVGEFNVSVAGQGTDAGFGAAQITIVTKRGQDAPHGSWFC